MRIVVYSTTTCPKCHQLKDHLAAKGHPYEEVLLDQDRSRLVEFQQLAPGVTSVPVTAIYTSEDTAPQVLHGFDPVTLDRALS